MKRLLFAVLFVTACQSAPVPFPAPMTTTPVVAPVPRVATLTVPARLPPAPGALPVNQFRAENGRVVNGRPAWTTLNRTVLGVLSAPGDDQRAPASILINGRTPMEVALWRDTDVASVAIEVDGVPYLNLPCQTGRGGPRRVCPFAGDDRAPLDRLFAAMRAGSVLRLVFLRGDAPSGEMSLSLAGFAERARGVGI